MMKFLKIPVVAVLIAVLVVFISTTVSISIKLHNKCETVTDGFYSGVMQHGSLTGSIQKDLNNLCDIASEVIIVADNYGINTKKLSSSTGTLRHDISYRNYNISGIYLSYSEFYNALRDVQIELSNTGLSQRHVQYMTEATEQIIILKQRIENAGYNESVKTFYKKFDRFPVTLFANFFDVTYPEYFA